MSSNIQESEAATRKRSHEEFVDGAIHLEINEASDSENLRKQASIEIPPLAATKNRTHLSPLPTNTMDSTPGSSPVPLTESGSSPPIRDSPSPNLTPSKLPLVKNTTNLAQTNTTPASASTAKGVQPAKRKTTAEAAKEKQERAEKRQKREAEAAEKQQLKQAEAAAKAAEKAAKDAAKAAKKAEEDEKKRKREEEKRQKDEEKLALERKQEKQKSLMANFFQRAPTTPSKKPIEQPTTSSPKPDAVSTTTEVEAKPQKSAYDRMFQPFFIKPGVTLACPSFEMDDETKATKSNILDQHIRGERGDFNPIPFNPTETFSVPFLEKRGIIPPSVRNIMQSVYGDVLDQVPSTRSESQTEKLAVSAQDQLNSIPMKYIHFYEDVRPPYIGTVTATHMETKKLRKLSRNPAGRVLRLEYDYDSEAEWVEDDGEDVDDEEDDEEDDGDEEMDDFLDDSDDVPAATRPTFLGEHEPTSTGICFEDQNGLNPCAATHKYRLEFMLETLDHHSGIDPFSTSYWPSAPKKVVTKATSTLTSAPSASMPPPIALTDAMDPYSRLIAGTTVSKPANPKTVIPKEIFDEFKQAVTSDELKELTKGTIVEMLAKKFPPCTKAQVKATLDRVALRDIVPGTKSTRQWVIQPQFS